MKAIIKALTMLVLFTLPILTIGQNELDKTIIYGYKHPKTNVYYFQDRDIPYGDSMVNDAFKKYNMLIVLEQGIWSNIPLKDKPRVKNGCELHRLDIYVDGDGELILEEVKIE